MKIIISASNLVLKGINQIFITIEKQITFNQ